MIFPSNSNFSLEEIAPSSFTGADGLYYRPCEVTAATLRHAFFTRPLRRACTELTEVELEIILVLREGEAFYRGGEHQPTVLWSQVLDGLQNGEREAIQNVLEAIGRYDPESTPFHAEHFRLMDFTVRAKLEYLHQLFSDETQIFVRALSVWKKSVSTLVNRPPSGRDVETRDRQIADLKSAYMEINGRIVDFLETFERMRLGTSCSAPATRREVADLVSSAAEGARSAAEGARSAAEGAQAAAERMDRRESRARKDMRIRFSLAQQEAASNYLSQAKVNSTLRREAQHQVTREQAYQYYRTELAALGLTTFALFKACLGARSNRLYRTRRKI